MHAVLDVDTTSYDKLQANTTIPYQAIIAPYQTMD
jgi:hypothetical protein